MRCALLCILGALLAAGMLPAQEAGALEWGARVTGRLDDSQPRQSWTFPGLRGQASELRLEVTSGDLAPLMLVLDARGELLVGPRGVPGGSAPLTLGLQLPANERYTVVVTRFGGSLGSTTGMYRLGLESAGLIPQAADSALRYGDQVSNHISDRAPQLRFIFAGRRGEVIHLRMRRTSGDLAPLLELRDSAGQLLARIDNSPIGAIEDFLIEVDGEYTVIATRHGQAAGASSGNFLLTLEEAEHSGLGRTPRAAIPLSSGEMVYGELSDGQATRHYRFEGRAGEPVRIGMERTGTLDPLLILADSELRELVSDDDGGGDQNARIEGYTLPAAGRYYILATRYEGETGSSAGGYRLELQLPQRLFAAAPPGVARIAWGRAQEGRIDDETPSLLYVFYGIAGDAVTATLERASGNLDPVLGLLDAEQALLASDDDSGAGRNARISAYRLPASGLYYLRATRYSGTEGATDTAGAFRLMLTRRFG